MPYSFEKIQNKIKDTEDWLKKELKGIRSGGATPTLLENITIDSYGSRTPISHVAGITVEDPRTLLISPWDKSHIESIQKAISLANLGLASSPDDKGVRVKFPELTKENRISIMKIVKEKIEKSKVAIRKEREEVWSDIQKKEKDGDISEDEKFKYKEELEKKIIDSMKLIDALFKKKEVEITE